MMMMKNGKILRLENWIQESKIGFSKKVATSLLNVKRCLQQSCGEFTGDSSWLLSTEFWMGFGVIFENGNTLTYILMTSLRPY